MVLQIPGDVTPFFAALAFSSAGGVSGGVSRLGPGQLDS